MAQAQKKQPTPALLASAIYTGHAYLTQGMLEEARKIFHGILILENNAYAHSVLGSIYQKKEEYDAALQHYSAAIRLFPHDVAALSNRGEILLARGQLVEAAADLNAAIALDPESKNLHANRARLLSRAVSGVLKVAVEEGREGLKKVKEQAEKHLAESGE